MAGCIRNHRRTLSSQLRPTPYPLPSHGDGVSGTDRSLKKTSLASEKKDWQDATCSVCMEYPHNAILLLCSSHEKGCRPYMCGTSFRHSNCLDQFTKAYAKEMPSKEASIENPNWSTCKKSDTAELVCPLCRGQVKGWTVVEPARKYLNKKKRSCIQDNCSFIGTYKQLQKHVRLEHPRAKPRKVDPVLEQKWKAMEHQREREDVISTITSLNPRSVVMGDYVIELDDSDIGMDDDIDDNSEGDRGIGLRSRSISRNLLYVLIREASRARLTRFNRDNEAVSADGGGGLPSFFSFANRAAVANGAADADVDAVSVDHLEGNNDAENGQGMRGGPERRRQRRRRRGRSASGVS